MKKSYDNLKYSELRSYSLKEEYEKIARCAEKNGESVNHMINRLLRDEVKKLTGIEIEIPETGTTRGPAVKYTEESK